MKNFFNVGKHICRLCKIAFHTIIRLAFICCFKLRSKILNRAVEGLGMSRQMGNVVNKCRDRHYQEADISLLTQQLTQQIEENGRLQQELDELKKIKMDQDEMIEKQFAKDVERTGKGRWNNAGDMNQPMSLSTDFMKIYNSEWMEVMRRLFGQENELKGIRFLSKTIKDCQSFCQTKAKEQILRFVNPCTHVEGQMAEVILSDEEWHDLYKLRRKIGLHALNKEALITLFTTECKESEDYLSVTQSDRGEATEYLDDYIRSCCELCWQFAISIPPMFLKFDVLGRNIAEIKDQFQEYHYTGQTEKGKMNTVMDVVWPAVVMKEDETDILLDKGYVIVFSSSAV